MNLNEIFEIIDASAEAGENGNYNYSYINPAKAQYDEINHGVIYNGRGVKTRCTDHWNNAVQYLETGIMPEFENEAKIKEIAKLIDVGFRFEDCVVINESGMTLREAQDYETWMLHTVLDFDLLTNIAHGAGFSRVKRNPKITELEEENGFLEVPNGVQFPGKYTPELNGKKLIAHTTNSIPEMSRDWFKNHPGFEYGVIIADKKTPNERFMMSHLVYSHGSRGIEQAIHGWYINEDGSFGPRKHISYKNKIIL